MRENKQIRKQQIRKNNRQVKVYYSFLTVVLLICLVQIARSAILNITKTLNYKVKVNKMLVLREEVQQQHDRLVSDIKNFGNLKSLEAIARNNLKLAGEDETLVIINKEKEEQPEIQEVPEADEAEENSKNTNKSKISVWTKLQNHKKKKS